MTYSEDTPRSSPSGGGLVRPGAGLVLTGVALVLLVGCASGPQVAGRTLSTYGAADAKDFDDSIDVVKEPQSLGGRWQDDWETELTKRFRAADLVALGTLSTVRIDEDLQGRTTLHLVLAVKETLSGSDEGGEVSLSVHEGDPGYTNVDRNREGVLQKPFVLFLKYFDAGEGQVVTHWHLSPESEYILTRVRSMAASPRMTTVKVIERKN